MYYNCVFTVPANAPLKRYRMRFVTSTDWEIIRLDMRPNVVDTLGLDVDNINLRYKPFLNVTNKQCITPTFDESPTPSPESELVFTES